MPKKGEPSPRRWIPTPEQLKQIKTMCGLGLPHKMIAEIFDIALLTLSREAERNEDLRKAMDKGNAEACLKLLSTAFQMATEGNNYKMLQFLLLNRLDYRTRERLPSTTEGEGIIDVTPSGENTPRSLREDDFKNIRDEARRIRLIRSQSS